MEIGDGPLRMRGGLENCTAVTFKQLQPRSHIACVIGSRLQFRHDAKIGAKETGSDVCTKLFARAIGAILVIAAEIAIQPVGCADPVRIMPISA